ncbi:hypothetical protein PG985_001415 [Apiospora marii]|uniref:Uncharacterized protein n=1 Tax=Apiospora marii TaxID=335849 RepID=A0ABR1RHW3_9PEZI
MPEFDSNTISSDSFEKYGVESRRQVSFDRVQDFVDRGLMSKGWLGPLCEFRASFLICYTDAVLERYTKRLTRNVPNVRSIEIAFQHLKDAGTEHLSSEKTMAAIKNAVVGIIEPPQSSAISELGLDILAWHASFPFPPALGPHSGLCDGIDQSSFARAVCLLSMRSVPGYGGRKRWGTWFPANPVYGGYSGNWGPHWGSYVSTRGKGASDFMRRIFRSLASPDYDDTASPHAAAGTEKTETSIPVLRFMYRLRLPEGEKETKDREGDEEPERPELAIMENEREVSIDIQDVLSECPPEEDRLTMNPFN